jgi:pyruvate/2-oxoglutarate dehydrogenase complex dihydrolipoamide dehydrogenase (E3) component
VATGAKPVDLKLGGQDLVTTSDRFFDLEELPERISQAPAPMR